MGETIGKIIFAVIALIVVAAVGSLILSAIGLLFGLIPLLIKLAIWGGLIYLAYLLVRKISHSVAD